MWKVRRSHPDVIVPKGCSTVWRRMAHLVWCVAHYKAETLAALERLFGGLLDARDADVITIEHQPEPCARGSAVESPIPPSVQDQTGFWRKPLIESLLELTRICTVRRRKS